MNFIYIYKYESYLGHSSFTFFKWNKKLILVIMTV